MTNRTPALNPLAHPIALARPQRLLWSGWCGHIPFGMFLIDLLRPQLLVELGTHRGVSYCAFCQAISELGLQTRAFAIDTWQGDSQAGGYGEEIYSDLRQYHDSRYGGFSTLVRSTFDEARAIFNTSSIDILHVDGCHEYEAARHDIETWLPKMSERGVILLHDICVTDPDFGVWRLWSEMKSRYRYFELRHSYGLGVLVVGPEAQTCLASLLDCTGEESVHITGLFEGLGLRWELEVENKRLTDEISVQKENIGILETQLFEFYALARNPLVRFARAWRRYGIIGLAKKVPPRLAMMRGRSRDKWKQH